ncbi:MAG: hypothetical protein KDA54_18005 [Phycisphaerales bacterium]|nr:hypothetical protein [Phycisphaerales bacterium]
MSRKQPHRPDANDADIQRDIRSHRKFNVAEAIGRMGGADLLKGASPVTLKRQAEFEIAQYLESQPIVLGDSLANVLTRHVIESTFILERGYEQPIVALKFIIDQLLRSEESLKEFVREIDAEWGRINQERPYFERPGQPPSPADPYTIESVRAALSKLKEALSVCGG